MFRFRRSERLALYIGLAIGFSVGFLLGMMVVSDSSRWTW